MKTVSEDSKVPVTSKTKIVELTYRDLRQLVCALSIARDYFNDMYHREPSFLAEVTTKEFDSLRQRFDDRLRQAAKEIAEGSLKTCPA